MEFCGVCAEEWSIFEERLGVSATGVEFLRVEYTCDEWSICEINGELEKRCGVRPLSSEYWHLQIYAYGHPAVKIGTPCKQ